jgi:hypothetical protein
MTKPMMISKEFCKRLDAYQLREGLDTRTEAVKRLAPKICRSESTVWRYVTGQLPIEGLVVDAIKAATPSP